MRADVQREDVMKFRVREQYFKKDKLSRNELDKKYEQLKKEEVVNAKKAKDDIKLEKVKIAKITSSAGVKGTVAQSANDGNPNTAFVSVAKDGEKVFW